MTSISQPSSPVSSSSSSSMASRKRKVCDVDADSETEEERMVAFRSAVLNLREHERKAAQAQVLLQGFRYRQSVCAALRIDDHTTFRQLLLDRKTPALLQEFLDVHLCELCIDFNAPECLTVLLAHLKANPKDEANPTIAKPKDLLDLVPEMYEYADHTCDYGLKDTVKRVVNSHPKTDLIPYMFSYAVDTVDYRDTSKIKLMASILLKHENYEEREKYLYTVINKAFKSNDEPSQAATFSQSLVAAITASDPHFSTTEIQTHINQALGESKVL